MASSSVKKNKPLNNGLKLLLKHTVCTPEVSVDVVKCQCSTQSLKDIGMQGKTIDALEQGLDVGRAVFLLLRGGLFDRPLHKLLNAAATEVPQGAVQWIHHAILDFKTVTAKVYNIKYS